MLLELTIINVASVIIKVAIKVDFNSPKTNFLVPSYLRRSCIGYDRLLIPWDVTREHRETGNAIQWRSQPEDREAKLLSKVGQNGCCFNLRCKITKLLVTMWWSRSISWFTYCWLASWGSNHFCGNANKLNTKYQNFSFLVWFKVFDLK